MKELQEEVEGRGEVKGKSFKQLLRVKDVYLYECTGESFYTHYEVFRRRENKQCNCVSYPKSNSFGKWAWTYNNFSDAMDKFNQLKENNK